MLPEEVFHAEVRHPRVPDLDGYAEIAAMVGVSRQRARDLQSLADFPAAVAEPSTGPLRVCSQVEARLLIGSRTPGRRPREKKPAPAGGSGVSASAAGGLNDHPVTLRSEQQTTVRTAPAGNQFASRSG